MAKPTTKDTKREREHLSEFINLYRDLPCLWDTDSDSYKDLKQKSRAWNLLVQNLKELDPLANVASAKKRIENLRTGYKREVRKVNESRKRYGSASRYIRKPNLWYYDLLCFLDNKDECHGSNDECLSEKDTFIPQEGTQETEFKCNKRTRRTSMNDHVLDQKRQKLIDTAQELLEDSSQKLNTFGVYIGEQLEQVSQFQRNIAEKLISDIIFLAKTERLDFDTKIDTQSRFILSPQNIKNSPLSTSPVYIKTSPSRQYEQSLPSPSYESSPNILSTALPLHHSYESHQSTENMELKHQSPLSPMQNQSSAKVYISTPKTL